MFNKTDFKSTAGWENIIQVRRNNAYKEWVSEERERAKEKYMNNAKNLKIRVLFFILYYNEFYLGSF